MQRKSLTCLVACGALGFVCPLSAQLAPADAEDILAASVRFLVDERYDGDTSDLKLGSVRILPDVVDTPVDSLALIQGVSEITGIPIHDRSLGRYCDASSPWPRWRWRDPGVPVSATLVSRAGDEAEVHVWHTPSLARPVRVRRVDGSWTAELKDDSVIHVQFPPCRPPPPDGLGAAGQVAFLGTAIFHVLSEQTEELPGSICLNSGGGLDDGWLEDVRTSLEAAIAERGVRVVCPEPPERWEWYVSLHHIVFFDRLDRVDVQVLSTSAEVETMALERWRAGGEFPFANPQVEHCELRAEASQWRVVDCRTVRMSRRYPRPGG